MLTILKVICSVIGKFRFRNEFVKKRSFIVDILFFDYFAVPLAILFSKFKFVTPNLITVVSLIISLGGIYFYYPGANQNFLLGCIILCIGNVLDGTDGKLARIKSIQSEFGAKLDNHFDKVRKVVAMVVLTYNDAENYILIICLIVIQYLSLYIPYKRASKLENIYAANGMKSLFEPLDAMILLIIIGPLFNCFLESLIVAIVLQIATIAINVYYRDKPADSPQTTLPSIEGEQPSGS